MKAAIVKWLKMKSQDPRMIWINERGDEQTFMSVRDIADKAGLPTATKKESMGICFVGKRRFADFIS